MATCANPKCRCLLRAESRSADNTSYCSECGDFVWAFRPNRDLADEWFVVSEEDRPTVGAEVSGEQCEGCGLSAYTIEPDGRHAWVAVCSGMILEGVEHPGCGARHPVRRKMAKDVIF